MGMRLVSISIDEGPNAFGETVKWGDQVELHDIGWAIRKLNQGERVYRTHWNGPNQFLSLIEADRDNVMDLPYVQITTVDGRRVPWLCSQTDLLAQDWELRK